MYKDFSIGRINISKKNKRTAISVKSNLFNLDDDIIVTACEDCVRFKIPELDYRGKTHKLYCTNSEWYITTLMLGFDLPIGNFEFDKESTEDELILNFKI